MFGNPINWRCIQRWAAAVGAAFLLLATYHARADEKQPGSKSHTIRVVVWDEQQPGQKPAYDDFLGNAIADHLKNKDGLSVKSVRMDDPDQGLPDAILNNTDVLIWWGHVRNTQVKEELGKKVVQRILAGRLSLITLHSAHWSQPFVQAMYERTRQDALKKIPEDQRDKVKIEYVYPPHTNPKYEDPLTPRVENRVTNGIQSLVVHMPYCVFPAWRADGMPSHCKTLMPEHPIASGIPKEFDLPKTEMYDEPFHVRAPDAVIFEEHWEKGEHFRSGCLWNLEKGKVFYFRPGHETFPIYRQELPLKIIENATRWLAAELPPQARE